MINAQYKNDSNLTKTYQDTSELGIHRFILQNGMVVLLKQRQDIPMVHVNLLVKTGSINEYNRLGSGISHYLEHMVAGNEWKKTDTEKSPYEKINQLGDHAANAYTNFNETSYHFTIASKYLEEGITIVTDMLKQVPNLNKKKLQSELEVILKEINRSNDSLYHQLWKMLFYVMYPESPYRYPVIGFPDLLRRLTKEDIESYYKKAYSPENMILTFVGDFDPNSLIASIEKTVGTIARQNIEPILVPIQSKQFKPRELETSIDVQHLHAAIGYPIQPGKFKDKIALFLLSEILNTSGHSFFDRLYENEKIVYRVSSYFYQSRYENNFTTFFKLEPNNWNKTYTIFKEEINKLKKHLIDPELLEHHKKIFLVELAQSMHDIVEEASFIIERELSGLPLDVDSYIEEINQIQVSDIQEVAQKYFKEERINIVKIQPKKKIKQASNSETNTKASHPLTTQKEVLKNGITLITQHDPSANSVGFTSIFTGGKIHETKENQGIHSLMIDMLTKGTDTLSKQEIYRQLKQLGNQFSISNSSLFSEITAFVLKEDFSNATKLMLEIISHGNFPEKELSKVKQEYIAEIKAANENISIHQHHLKLVRFEEHPLSFFHLGTIDSISKISSKDLIQLRNEIFTPENMTLCVIGNFDKQNLIKELNQVSKFSQRKYTVKVLPEVNKITRSREKSFNINPKNTQTAFNLAFDIDDIHPNTSLDEQAKEYLILIYLDFVSSNIRLFSSLRKHGLVYQAGASFKKSLKGSIFNFNGLTEKEKLDKSIELLQKEIKNLYQVPFSQDELQLAKNTILNMIIRGDNNPVHKSRSNALREKVGLGYQFIDRLIKLTDDIHAKDIQKVAQRYFKDKPYVLSITTPENTTPVNQ